MLALASHASAIARHALLLLRVAHARLVSSGSLPILLATFLKAASPNVQQTPLLTLTTFVNLAMLAARLVQLLLMLLNANHAPLATSLLVSPLELEDALNVIHSLMLMIIRFDALNVT